MRKTGTFLFVLWFSVALQAQKPITTGQRAVQQTVINMFDALSNRDSVSLKMYCTDDIALYEYG